MASLKLAEIFGESGFQLMIQLVVVSYEENILKFDAMSTLQLASIVTSTITIIQTIVGFVVNARREFFVSRQFPFLASFIPYYLFFLSGICAAIFAIKIIFRSDVFKMYCFSANSKSWPDEFQPNYGRLMLIVSCLFLILNWINFIVSVLIVWLRIRPSCSWRVTRSIIKSLCSCGALVSLCLSLQVMVWFGSETYLTNDAVYEAVGFHNNVYFYLYCLSWLVNFILGLTLFPSKHLVPRLIAPIIFAVVGGLRVVMEVFCPNKCNLYVQWKLDKVVRVEETASPVESEVWVAEGFLVASGDLKDEAGKSVDGSGEVEAMKEMEGEDHRVDVSVTDMNEMGEDKDKDHERNDMSDEGVADSVEDADSFNGFGMGLEEALESVEEVDSAVSLWGVGEVMDEEPRGRF